MPDDASQYHVIGPAQTPRERADAPAVTAATMAVCDVFFAVPEPLWDRVIGSLLCTMLGNIHGDPADIWEQIDHNVRKVMPEIKAKRRVR